MSTHRPPPPCLFEDGGETPAAGPRLRDIGAPEAVPPARRSARWPAGVPVALAFGVLLLGALAAGARSAVPGAAAGALPIAATEAAAPRPVPVAPSDNSGSVSHRVDGRSPALADPQPPAAGPPVLTGRRPRPLPAQAGEHVMPSAAWPAARQAHPPRRARHAAPRPGAGKATGPDADTVLVAALLAHAEAKAPAAEPGCIPGAPARAPGCRDAGCGPARCRHAVPVASGGRR